MANQFPKNSFILPLLFMNHRLSIFLRVLPLLLSTHFLFGQSETISSLKFLGEYDVLFNKSFENTSIGGLSGIDYDEKNQRYFLISDDRSAINPARYYTAKIYLTEKGIDSVQFVSVHNLVQPNGSVYPNFKADPAHTPDPESIRYNPKTSTLVWTSEGERTKRQGNFVRQDPAITTISLEGKCEGVYQLAANATMHETELGPRQNGALEGVTFANDYKILYASMEEPLYEDGPPADITENGASVRIYKYDVTTKKSVAQYAYQLEPVAFAPTPPTAFKVNGISEILALNENRLLVVERSFSTGRLACTVKVFTADISKADDITSVISLKGRSQFQFAQKKLLLNMDTLGIYIDNVEGVAFGPRLANGHQTLVFLSDNNFSVLEKTQFLLFEVIP